MRKDGIETVLDQYLNGAPVEGWPRWMMDQLDKATYVLVVCTETYYRRFRGHEEPGKGKGVDWEGAFITNELYAARSSSLKFIPIILSALDEACMPEPLRGAGYHDVTSEAGYQGLYYFLLQQAGVEPAEVGTLKTKARAQGVPLTFGAPAAVPSVTTAEDIDLATLTDLADAATLRHRGAGLGGALRSSFPVSRATTLTGEGSRLRVNRKVESARPTGVPRQPVVRP